MKKIKRLRIESKLTQRQLAEKINVSQGRISQWENEENTYPKLSVLMKLSVIFGVSMEDVCKSEKTN